jgi:hypothetical protein
MAAFFWMDIDVLENDHDPSLEPVPAGVSQDNLVF